RKVREQLEFLFAEVEHLPAPFNQADTAAENRGEGRGLCAALEAAGRTMITHSTPSGASGRIPMQALEAAWLQWNGNAIAALNDAIATKSEMPGIPSLVVTGFHEYTGESIGALS